MRVKNILSLLAFSAAFVFSVMLVGLPEDNFYLRLDDARTAGRDRQNIRMFLWQDINRGRERNQTLVENSDPSTSSFDVNQLADAVEDYVDEAQSADDSNLPVDFQAAWQAHMNAWREHSNFLSNLRESQDRFDDSPLGNNPLNLNDFDRQVYLNQGEKINRTWFEVLRVGRKYGAYVPVE